MKIVIFGVSLFLCNAGRLTIEEGHQLLPFVGNEADREGQDFRNLHHAPPLLNDDGLNLTYYSVLPVAFNAPEVDKSEILTV